MISGLMLLAFAGTFGQARSTEVQTKIEQLRLLSSQANDQAVQCDQSATNEDRLSLAGPSWAKLIHQLAAAKFRDLASQNRETARQYVAQAQVLERQSDAERSHAVPTEAEAGVIPATARVPATLDDYLSVTDVPKIETAIEAYLNRSGIKALTVTGNNGAMHFVQVGFAGQNGLPNLLYKVTALPPRSSGSEPPSQMIVITLETNVKASTPSETLYAALGEANKIGNCAWFVDLGEIKCRSWISIPGPAYPVPAELIRDKIRFINGDWLRLSPPIFAAVK
jgi:hypothetical protein